MQLCPMVVLITSTTVQRSRLRKFVLMLIALCSSISRPAGAAPTSTDGTRRWLSVTGPDPKTGAKVHRCISVIEFPPAHEFRPQQLPAELADEKTKYFPNGKDWGYVAIGPPTKRQDCAGYVMQRLWGKGPYWVTSDNLFTNVIMFYGKREYNSYRPDDIVVWRRSSGAGHVALVTHGALRMSSVQIATKDGPESIYKATLNPKNLLNIFEEDPLIANGHGNPEIWRIEQARTNLKLSLAKSQDACEEVAFPDCSEGRLTQAMRTLIPRLPYFGQSAAAKQAITRPLQMGYGVDQADNAVSVSFKEPAKVTLGANWDMGCLSHVSPAERQRLEQFYTSGKECAEAKVMPYASVTVKPGGLGDDSCLGSSAVRGTMDPLNYGDPYMGLARVSVMAPSFIVTVNVTIAISPPASHGARDKPEVIQAVQTACEDWAKKIAAQILAAAGSPAGPFAHPAAGATGNPTGSGHPGGSQGTSNVAAAAKAAARQHHDRAISGPMPAQAYEAELREAIRLDPTNAQYHVELGLHLSNHRLPGAEQELREAVRLNPTDKADKQILDAFLKIKADEHRP